VTPKALFQHQTIAELVAATAAAETPGESLPRATVSAPAPAAAALVELNHSAAKPSIFFTPYGGGSVDNYTWLAELLSPQARALGFDESAIRDTPAAQLDVAAMASVYAQIMRDQQPHGPYFLVGWSFGGVSAFEIARLMVEAGEDVGLLCIIDTPLVVPEWHDVASDHAEKTRAALAELARSDPGRPPSSALLAALAAVDLTEEVLVLGHDGVFDRLSSILRSSSSLTAYTPKPVDCDILLYEAEGTLWPDPLCDTWKPVVRDIEYRIMPGRHGALLAEPHVRTVVRDIAEILGRWT
jgi:thioesterase domain-containing protein